MILCDNGHEQICHEGGWCPLCDIIEKKEELESQVERLETELEEVSDGR